ncbi:MAG: transglycosylase SLT domain-containing protein, partial [bacterium]
IFAEEGLPLELAYLAAVESNFNHHARSRARATGLWQFMYYTARRFGLRVSYPWYDERLDPELSTRAAARFLVRLHDVYDSWELALAAYNAGEGRVNRALRRARRKGKKTDYWSLHLPAQTREYVPAFMAVAMLYRSATARGLTRPLPEPPRVIDTVEVDFASSLAEVAHRLNLPLKEMVRLNPAWRRGYIPAGLKGGVALRLPLGMKTAFFALANKQPAAPIPWLTHRVEVGETLAKIARGYGVSIAEIRSVNPIPNRNFLAIGQRLIIPLPPGHPNKKRPRKPALGAKARARPLAVSRAPGQTPAPPALGAGAPQPPVSVAVNDGAASAGR